MDNNFEHIVPWNGANDTGRDARLKLQRNFEKIGANFIELAQRINDNSQGSAALVTKFIRKDAPDSTRFRVDFRAGADYFDFVTGMIAGAGASFYKDEAGKTVLETDKILCREEIIVPAITFNTIEVNAGDRASTFAYGIIDAVDKATMTATLRLLEDELGTPRVDDFIRGIFHNIVGGNSPTTEEDANGFLRYCGFSTAYFMPTEILVNKPGQFQFKYILQPGTSVHPMPGMKFFAYGNKSDVTRQSITYENRYYTRLLSNVDDWVIVPDKHIRFQCGKLDGTNISGVKMTGYGVYGDNTYFKGIQVQLTPEQIEQLKPEQTKIYQIITAPTTIRINSSGVLSNPDVYAYVVEKDGSKVTRLAALPVGYNMSFQINMRPAQPYLYEDTINLAHEDAWMITFFLWQDSTLCDKASVPLIRDGHDGVDGAPGIDGVDGAPGADGLSPYHCSIEPQHSIINVLEGGWFDRIPAGKEQLWATRCDMPSETRPSMSPWSRPFKLESTTTHRFLYSEDADPSTLVIDDDLYDWPDTPAVYPQESEANLVWKSKPSPKTRWIAERENEYGIWRSWWRHEITNEKKITHAEAWAFTRAKDEPVQPTGGSPESPIPNNNLEPANLPLTAIFEHGLEKQKTSAWWKVYYSDDNTTWHLFYTVEKYVQPPHLVPISPAHKFYKFEAWPWGFNDAGKRYGIATASLIQDGRKGEQGLAGPNYIPIEWEEGKIFLNDESKTGGIRVVHIGLMRDDALASGWRGYKCRKTHVASADNRPDTKGGAEYWEESGINVAGIITSWIAAKNGVMQFFASNEILINDDSGNICLGLTGGDRKDGTKTPIRLWVGAQTPDNAPFRIDQRGEFWATNAHIMGDVTARAGKIGGFTINGYKLTNLNNEDAYISIRTQDGSAYREAILGTGLPATFGAPVNAVFNAHGAGDYENVAMYISATGSTSEYFALKGKKNLAIRATGGVRWSLNLGDHWCMPGVLGIYRCDIIINPNGTFKYEFTHVWGNGVPPLLQFNPDNPSADYTKWDETNVMGNIRYAYNLAGPAMIIAQCYHQAWSNDSKWSKIYNISALIESETTKGFNFSVWRGGDKVLPQRVDFVLIGVPNK